MVDVQPEIDHQALAKLRRIYAAELALSADAEAELAKLQGDRDAVYSQLNNEEDEEDSERPNDDEIYERIEEIDNRIRSIQRNRKRAYTEDVKAACGVVVSIGFHGEPEFCYGLLRREDEAELANTTATTDEFSLPASISNPKEEEPRSPYSAPLIEALTMHKTAAIAAELTQQPRIALAALVHALLISEFGLDIHLYRSKSCLQVSSSQVDLREAQASSAFISLEEQRENWFSKLPSESGDLWKRCLEQDQDTLLRLLAFCAARSLNGVKTKADDGQGRLKHSNELAIALDIDMKKWFAPTAENFFSKVSKARITEALTEAGKPPTSDTAKVKKADFAAFAEKEIQGTGWLPEPVRVSTIEGEEMGFSLHDESTDKVETEGAQ